MLPLLRWGFWGVMGLSNWREMQNVLEAIRAKARLERMVGCEAWMDTDNDCTAEASCYKGRKLDAMVLELLCIAIAGNFLLRLVHIAGTRMIDMIGIDALSRGELQAGALAKATTEHTIPLHLHHLERSMNLSDWLSSWLLEFSLASPKDWFYLAHGTGHYSTTLTSELKILGFGVCRQLPLSLAWKNLGMQDLSGMMF